MSDVSSSDGMVDHLLLSLGEPSRDSRGRDAEFLFNVDNKSANVESPNGDKYRSANRSNFDVFQGIQDSQFFLRSSELMKLANIGRPKI